MKIELIFFGQLTDIVGASSLMVDSPGTIEELKKIVIEKYPALATMQYTIAVNNKITFDNVVITENDTIAWMPPFSGG